MQRMLYLLTFYIRGGCRPREEEMHSFPAAWKVQWCLIFPFITVPGLLFVCLLFTRCCEVCSFMCLVLCSSATGCEAIYLFVLCSWQPLIAMCKRERKITSYPLTPHTWFKPSPQCMKKGTVPVRCDTEGHRIHHKLCSRKTSSGKLIIILMAVIGKHLYFFLSFANVFYCWSKWMYHFLASKQFALPFI